MDLTELKPARQRAVLKTLGERLIDVGKNDDKDSLNIHLEELQSGYFDPLDEEAFFGDGGWRVWLGQKEGLESLTELKTKQQRVTLQAFGQNLVKASADATDAQVETHLETLQDGYLDVLGPEDFFGTEGWEHWLNVD